MSKPKMAQYPSPTNTMGSEPKQANFSQHPGHGSARRTAQEAAAQVKSNARNPQITAPR
jgi:hypothetical protein